MLELREFGHIELDDYDHENYTFYYKDDKDENLFYLRFIGDEVVLAHALNVINNENAETTFILVKNKDSYMLIFQKSKESVPGIIKVKTSNHIMYY